MRRFALALAALVALGLTPAMAETMIEDTDGDGSYNMDEMKAAYPDLTEEVFIAVDADGDGLVTMDELTAARAAGTIGA